MAVVTLSGQSGAGAREAGRLAATRLGLDYIDQEILVGAAQALGVPVEAVAGRDERTASFGERVAHSIRHFLERSAAAGTSDPMLGSSGLDVVLSRTYAEAAAEEGLPDISDKRYLEVLTGLVRDLARHDNVLIVGRGSQVILKDWPGAVHVLLVAPQEHRIEEVASRDGLAPEKAAKHVHEIDKGRKAFHDKFFHVKVDDPSLYHLSINTARISYEEAGRLIAAVVRERAAAGQEG
jgi:cytidylate kinase